jgi:hypothetical protein
MVCALTVRTIKSGAFEDFRKAFMELNEPEPPAGWVRFNMVRKTDDPDEVICFGFYDGTVDELRAAAADGGYAEQMEKIAPYVESVGADGLYEVVEDYSAAPAGRA